MSRLTARQSHYLHLMGIQTWRSRGAVGVREADDTTERPVSSDSQDISKMELDALRSVVAKCTACALHQSRTQTVFGVGDPKADWMIVGEAPGAEEDRQGEPFVGRAGMLLNAMLAAVGFKREQVYIANILKCRPPGNRDPRAEEVQCCLPFLHRQIDLIRPKLILCVGRVAAQQLLHTDAPLARLRGRVHRLDQRPFPVVVTYHPAYLLRTPRDKYKAWQDLKFARKVAGSLT